MFDSWVGNLIRRAIQLAELSLLWMGFVLLGLVVFGIGPATVALCTSLRRWIQGSPPDQLLAEFWTSFRKEFLLANQITWMLYPISLFLGADTWLALRGSIPLVRWSLGPILGLDLLFAAVLVYTFPLLAYCHLSRPSHYLRMALVAAITNPIRTIALLTLIYAWTMLLHGLITLLGMSALTYVIVRVTLLGIDRVSALASLQTTPADGRARSAADDGDTLHLA